MKYKLTESESDYFKRVYPDKTEENLMKFIETANEYLRGQLNFKDVKEAEEEIIEEATEKEVEEEVAEEETVEESDKETETETEEKSAEEPEVTLESLVKALGLDTLKEVIGELNTKIDVLVEKVNTLEAANEAQKKEITDLHKSEDEKIADAISPAIDWRMAAFGFKASESGETEATDEEIEKVKEDGPGEADMKELLNNPLYMGLGRFMEGV